MENLENRTPMTEAELENIEAYAKTFAAPYLKDVLAEVRRLRKCQIQDWCPGVPVSCQKHVDQLGMDVFQANVERDNLRKMLEDSNQREQALIQSGNELRRQRDDARDARDAALKQAGDLDAALLKVLKTPHTCENGYAGGPDCPGCKAIIDLGDFKPVPMCKPDALADLFPPARKSE